MSRPTTDALAPIALLALLGCEASPYRTATVETHSATTTPAEVAGSRTKPALRFAVAAIESPRDTYSVYTGLFDRVGQLLGRPVEFEQRRTYREVNDLLISGGLDAALLCTGGYLDLQRRAPRAVEVLAVPVVGGGQSYQSVVVVSAKGGAKDLPDLRNARFAFTDELSFSGRLYVLRLLRDRGFDPEHFFGSVTYTGSHDRSIEAVASGLVDGATVHGGVLQQLEQRDPSLRAKLRVIHRSPPLGGMPVVASARLDAATRERLRSVLLTLEEDPAGAEVLRHLRFERFAAPAPGLYAAATRVLDGR